MECYYPDNGKTFYVGQRIYLSPINNYQTYIQTNMFISSNLPSGLTI